MSLFNSFLNSLQIRILWTSFTGLCCKINKSYGFIAKPCVCLLLTMTQLSQASSASVSSLWVHSERANIRPRPSWRQGGRGAVSAQPSLLSESAQECPDTGEGVPGPLGSVLPKQRGRKGARSTDCQSHSEAPGALPHLTGAGMELTPGGPTGARSSLGTVTVKMCLW